MPAGYLYAKPTLGDVGSPLQGDWVMDEHGAGAQHKMCLCDCMGADGTGLTGVGQARSHAFALIKPFSSDHRASMQSGRCFSSIYLGDMDPHGMGSL